MLLQRPGWGLAVRGSCSVVCLHWWAGVCCVCLWWFPALVIACLRGSLCCVLFVFLSRLCCCSCPCSYVCFAPLSIVTPVDVFLTIVTKRRSSWACIGNPKLEQESNPKWHTQDGKPANERGPTMQEQEHTNKAPSSQPRQGTPNAH